MFGRHADSKFLAQAGGNHGIETKCILTSEASSTVLHEVSSEKVSVLGWRWAAFRCWLAVRASLIPQARETGVPPGTSQGPAVAFDDGLSDAGSEQEIQAPQERESFDAMLELARGGGTPSEPPVASVLMARGSVARGVYDFMLGNLDHSDRAYQAAE